MTISMVLRLSFAGLFAMLGCGGSAPPAVAPARSKHPVDQLRDVDGTPIGTAAEAITDLAPVSPVGRGVRKRAAPRPVFGFVPVDASYTFDAKGKLGGAIWSMARADCDKVGEAVKRRLGPPNDGNAWEGAEIRLVLTRLGDDCAVVWGLRETFEHQPPPTTSPAAGRFGEATLGAPLATFKNLERREAHEGTVYYRPEKKAYEGVALSRISYAFRDDKLVSVSFDVAVAKDCARMLEALKRTFGAAPKAEPNLGKGTSYSWIGGDWALKLNDFGATQCSGILFAQSR